MKSIKLFLILFCTVCAASVGVVSCEKSAANVEAVEAQENDYTDIDDSEKDISEPIELEDRASAMTVKTITCSALATAAAFNDCPSIKLIGHAILAEGEMKVTGTGFGATQGNSTIEAYDAKTPNAKFICGPSFWSDTEVRFNITNQGFDKKNYRMRVNITNPAVPVSGGTTKLFTKGISMKTVGQHEDGTIYGSSDWECSKKKTFLGRDLGNGPIALTASYVPEEGDILADNENKWAVVDLVTPPDSKGFYTVKTLQRNKKCNGYLRTAKFKYKGGVFVAKKDGYTFLKAIH